MTLLLVRHGPTAWNRSGRLQGRADVPLDDEGEAAVRAWRLPDAYGDATCLTSPLQRARRTAELLGYAAARSEPSLIELDWGAWEGRTLAELRRADPDDLARREALGLDFRAPGGESYREVQARAAHLLDGEALRVAVTHRGVILALLAQVTDWNMVGPPPLLLDKADALEIGPNARTVRAVRLA